MEAKMTDGFAGIGIVMFGGRVGDSFSIFTGTIEADDDVSSLDCMGTGPTVVAALRDALANAEQAEDAWKSEERKNPCIN